MESTLFVSGPNVFHLTIFHTMNSVLNMSHWPFREKSATLRTFLRWVAAGDKVTSQDVQDLNHLTHLQTQPSPSLLHAPLPAPPPPPPPTTTYFLHQDSLPPLLECHSYLGGFNVAFNPHRLIITLTFTLHSIKFLTADLLQWLLVLQEAAVIMPLIKRLGFIAAFFSPFSAANMAQEEFEAVAILLWLLLPFL